MNYYNENDEKCANWLRDLIARKLIPSGFVDDRDVQDVRPYDLREFTQCHFFAGIGGWSRALQLAAWPADKKVWTGSCPCQSFSASGKQKGFADERHLWPFWFHLIQKCQPSVVFGEQVASKLALEWYDLVSDDMEGAGYAIGASDLCAASVNAPHIRQRLWFVAERLAYTNSQRLEGWTGMQERPNKQLTGERSLVNGMADTKSGEQQGKSVLQGIKCNGEDPGRAQGVSELESCCIARSPSANNGFWSDPDWLGCRDGKFRPTKPGVMPLVARLPERLGLIQGYGNSIVPQVAAEFIGAYMA